MSVNTGENGVEKDDKRVAQLESEMKLLEARGSDTPHTIELLQDEINRAQGKNKGTPKYLDVTIDKPVKVSVKVLVPTKEYPSFNFKGKLLGPMGNTLKRLQEDTMTRMSVRGRGSMRDRKKEDECRASKDSKYDHLNEELHVDISAVAPCAEAYARISYALVEIHKYLTPDLDDEITHEQMEELNMMSGGGMHPKNMMMPGPPSMRGRGMPRGRGAPSAPAMRRPTRRPMASATAATTAPSQQLYQRRGPKPALLQTPPLMDHNMETTDEYSDMSYSQGAYKQSIFDKQRYRPTPY